MSPRRSATKPAPQPAPKSAPAKRTYNSTRRKQQAADTRAEVLGVAMRLFNESGWAGTTVGAIADAAGVAVETVYSGFGSKKALLRDAADVSAVGDADPVPYVERETFERLAAGSIAARIQLGMDIISDVHERSAGLWRAIQDAAEGDDEMTAWAIDAEQRRRHDTGLSLERIFERKISETALDVLWVLYGPETYRKLVQEAGHSRAEYQRCIAEATLRMVGEDLSALDDL